MRNLQKFCSALLLLSLLTGCVAGSVGSPPPGGAASIPSPTSSPTPTPEPTPTPPAEIDAASADSEGRVWVRYTGDAQPPIKVQILREGEETAYNYDLPADGTPIALPLTQGEGTYTVSVLEHIEDKRYRPVLTQTVELTLSDPNAPFLHPNRMVDYAGTATEIIARRLVEDIPEQGAQIDCLLTYVAEKLTYDEEKSSAAASGEMTGYIPDLDAVLIGEQGICYDYAALLCAMLRSRGIPCKLQVGWAGNLYHAWVEVWSEEPAELAGGITLQEGWNTLDPTFLSTQGRTADLAAYMAGAENYKVRYTY